MNTSEARRLVNQVAQSGEGRMILVIEKDRSRARDQFLDFIREVDQILPAGATIKSDVAHLEATLLGRRVRFEYADERLVERARGVTLSTFWMRDGAMRHLDPELRDFTMAVLGSRCL